MPAVILLHSDEPAFWPLMSYLQNKRTVIREFHWCMNFFTFPFLILREKVDSLLRDIIFP